MREIIRLAFELARAVEALMVRTRAFYYEVMLSGHTCLRCGGALRMIGESRCRCPGCGHEFDPTVAYQRCTDCDGTPRLRVSRYVCRRCGRDVRSRFVFDARVFDREYFRQRMADSRERKRAEQERRPPVLVTPRSEELQPAPAHLEAVPGLTEALDGLVGAPELMAWLPLMRGGFDLKRYSGVCALARPPLQDTPNFLCKSSWYMTKSSAIAGTSARSKLQLIMTVSVIRS